MNKLTENEVIEKLQEIIDVQSCDIEAAHSKADNVLHDFVNSLGYEKIAALYKAIPKWYA